jgi:hypothetical protein
MSEPTDDTGQIESLLRERRQLRDWLDRLDAAGSSAPEAVRRRVRADYEGRLADLVARLGGFAATLRASLAALEARRDELSARQAEAQEHLAEAELRHAVGEYSPEKWESIQRAASEALGTVGAELGAVGEEIARLEEVVAQVGAGDAPRPRHPEARRMPGDDVEAGLEAEPEDRDVTLVTEAAPPSEPGIEIVSEPEVMPLPRRHAPEAPRFTPRDQPSMLRPRERDRGRTLRFPGPEASAAPSPPGDELSFLKSVALDTGAAVEADSSQALRSSRAAGAARTLKCADCGAMNRPTEWYCDKCGAELATL